MQLEVPCVSFQVCSLAGPPGPPAADGGAVRAARVLAGTGAAGPGLDSAEYAGTMRNQPTPPAPSALRSRAQRGSPTPRAARLTDPARSAAHGLARLTDPARSAAH